MWDWLKDATFWCVQWFQSWCGDWGLAIILMTIVFRALIYPITAKQIKSSYSMQRIQPYIKEIQAKYADDPQRLNEEMMKVYADHKFNPLAGCLPMLLQMPIFILLYQTLQELTQRVVGVTPTLYHLIPDLGVSLSGVPGMVGVDGWQSSAVVAAIPFATLVILFAVTTFIPMLMQGNKEKSTIIMTVFMSFFMLWIGWSAPAGVMLFWVTSQLLGIIQQQVIQTTMKKKDEKAAEGAVEIKPVEVDVTRKVKKSKPTKKR